MDKIPILMREPRMGDYNKIANIINQVIDKLEKKINIIDLQITKIVKDYGFFKGVETKLPYNTHLTISNLDEYQKLIETYNLDRYELEGIKGVIDNGDVVSLGISITEEITEKDIKQEEIFNIIETKPLENIVNDIKEEAVKTKEEGQKQEQKQKQNKSLSKTKVNGKKNNGWGKRKDNKSKA